MHWLNLPAPESSRQPAFQDLAGAKAWLAAQPQTQALLMQAALTEQIQAIDAAGLPPARSLELLDVLHSASIPVQTSLEVRFTRKALPMLHEEECIFTASQNLWTRIGLAYLRISPHFSPKEKCPLLQRAANAFRMAEYTHFLAGRACPVLLDQLLLFVLAQADNSGVLRQPHLDPDFRHFGEANIAGLLVWAFLLRLINPYRLTAAQLTVANRALSRWRELCAFHPEADHAAHVQLIPFAKRLGAPLPDGLPQWIDIHPICRKIHSRIVSLRAGATPESLKLGRELSGTACVRLLSDIDQHLLNTGTPPALSENGQIPLAFGIESAFALFAEELLNPDTPMDVQSTTLANERMAVFGFNHVEHMPTAVQKLEIPSEDWQVVDGIATRQPDAGPRRFAPCLISTIRGKQPRLGVLRGLLSNADNMLRGELDWFNEHIEACRLQQPVFREQKQSHIGVFLLSNDEQMSLVIPNNAPIRPGIGIALEGTTVWHVVPTEVIERGIDFVRYACRAG